MNEREITTKDGFLVQALDTLYFVVSYEVDSVSRAEFLRCHPEKRMAMHEALNYYGDEKNAAEVCRAHWLKKLEEANFHLNVLKGW